MRIELEFYATLRDAVDERPTVAEVDDDTTVGDALRAFAADNEKLKSLLFRSNGDLRRHVTIALNGDPLFDDRAAVALSNGDTLVLSPGVSGGEGSR